MAPASAPANPITNDMLKFLRLWNRRRISGLLGQQRKRDSVLQSAKIARVFRRREHVHVQGRNAASSPIIYYGVEYCAGAMLWRRLAGGKRRTRSTGDPRFHRSAITIPTAFATAGEASALQRCLSPQ
jgi:hypothetical protein